MIINFSLSYKEWQKFRVHNTVFQCETEAVQAGQRGECAEKQGANKAFLLPHLAQSAQVHFDAVAEGRLVVLNSRRQHNRHNHVRQQSV